MGKPLVIGVHVNEGTLREPNPHVPWTPDEIAATAAAARAEGAALMHFHGRTPEGGVDHSARTYGEIIAKVRAGGDMLLAPAPANVPGWSVPQRLSNLAPNQGRPETRSDFLVVEMGLAAMDLLDPRSGAFVTDDRTFRNDTRTQIELLDRADELGMTPYAVSFNVSWTRAAFAHARTRPMPSPLVLAFILGGAEFPAAHPATAAGLRAQLDLLPADIPVEWIVSAYRGNVFEAAEEAVARGGHVAIGAGDHHYGELGYPSTPELVARVAELGRRHGREPATPAQARALLGVPA
jgi:3-keto-5-aminohexanoate cleavage enzyme